MNKNHNLIVLLVLIVGISVVARAQPFDDYVQEVPGEPISIEMVAVSGGSFSMGAAEDSGRPAAEKPSHVVTVDDFWMAKFEITWEQYDAFVFGEFGPSRFKEESLLKELGIDAVTGATAPWEDMSFGMGSSDEHPAVNMTQYAALMYAKWLTSKTGVYYRLPTEAEWEYACKSGQTGTAKTLSDVAVFADNAGDGYETTGAKQANDLGIHDLLGNVSEWVMDQYSEGFYADSPEENPWNRPTTLYPRVARGGSWTDAADDVSCTARKPSQSIWKIADPQIPKSDWWHTSAPFVGFRVVRPRKQPSPEEIKTFWLEAMPDYGLN